MRMKGYLVGADASRQMICFSTDSGPVIARYDWKPVVYFISDGAGIENMRKDLPTKMLDR